MQDGLGELLYLMAMAEMRTAAASGDASLRETQLAEALRLNTRSHEVFASATPRAVLLQQAQIVAARAIRTMQPVCERSLETDRCAVRWIPI